MSIYGPKFDNPPPYIPRNRDERLAKLVEEMAEFIMLYGKAGRFGMMSHHPKTLESNTMAMLRELQDVQDCMSGVIADLKEYAVLCGELDDTNHR